MAQNNNSNFGNGNQTIVGGDFINIDGFNTVNHDILANCIDKIMQEEVTFEENSTVVIDLDKKMKLNNLKKYENIFKEASYLYDDIQKIVDDFNESMLMRKVKYHYIESRNKNLTGDAVLDDMVEKISVLVNGAKVNKADYGYSICLLLWFVFSKCQILEKE